MSVSVSTFLPEGPSASSLWAFSNRLRVPSARQLVYADSRADSRGRLPDDTWILRPQDLPDGFRPEEDTESTTVGGLVAEWVGHVPQVGEAVEHGGIRVEVLAGNERRVEQVRISRVGTLSPVAANS